MLLEMPSDLRQTNKSLIVNSPAPGIVVCGAGRVRGG